MLVLRLTVHGIPGEEYAAALRERLPDREVRYARTPAEERELIPEATVVTGGDLPADLLERAENLRLFACTAAGYDHLDLDAFEERGVAVTNASGVHGPNIAEHVIGAMLAFARDFLEARRRQDRREWRSFPSTELAGSTVAIVGLGAIGQATVRRLEGFDVHTVGVRHSPEKGGPTDEVYGFDGIHEAVVDAEYVVLACPLTDATRELVDRDVLRTMPADAVLVNVARGGVVDTAALVWALRGNSIRGAALDVTDPEPLPERHPLWTFDNVLITPHNSGHTPAYFERRADILADNLAAVAAGGEWSEVDNRVA